MEVDELVAFTSSSSDVEVLLASKEGAAPQAAWGDVFLTVRGHQMPFATIVNCDCPGLDEASQLSGPGVFRLNLAIGRPKLTARVGDTEAEHPAVLDEFSGSATLSVASPLPVVSEGGLLP